MRRLFMLRIVPAAALVSLLFVSGAQLAQAQDRVEDFKKNCMSCHTIGGGRLVGPDLKDVTERQERDWLARFIVDPLGIINSGDPYALKLRDEARGALMTAVPGRRPSPGWTPSGR